MFKNNNSNIYNSKIKELSIKITVKILIVILLLSAALFYPLNNHLSAQTLEEQLQNIKNEQEANKKKIEEAKKKEQEYLKQVKSVEDQLLSSLSELKDLNEKQAKAKSDIDRTTVELASKEQELNQINDELKQKTEILNQRISVIYKNGNESILEILFKAKDFIDFISKIKLMTLIAKEDIKIIREVKDKREAELNIKKGMLDLIEKQKKSKQDIAKLVSQAEQKNAEIEKIYGEKSILLSKAQSDKNALLALQKELEAKESETARILESYKYGSAPTGRLLWPVLGYIASGFGMRFHPILHTYRFHSGIDIVASYGTPVEAADGGQVIQVGYDGGYGNSILIYHGGGFATWYAHLSGFNCSVGQMVTRGQIIGFVGSTGLATGPHLHFEVRINGAAQNPLQYLP
ncbi:MAG: peptidoglycan DD-metalloendopeptidase family protein [Actinobacteria bacterium]|nr:peptidoglycan DD-metalloendopeptidase family protein [Actinomycetota bacterium]